MSTWGVCVRELGEKERDLKIKISFDLLLFLIYIFSFSDIFYSSNIITCFALMSLGSWASGFDYIKKISFYMILEPQTLKLVVYVFVAQYGWIFLVIGGALVQTFKKKKFIVIQ